MSHFTEMEWNSKWDWENLVSFGSSKAIESPKKLQLADWMNIVDDGEIHGGSFNLSGASHGSSVKSSISASTDSSIKDGIQTPNFNFTTFEGSSGNCTNKMEVSLEASVGSGEPLIGLKLGKRTYFENNSGGSGGSAKITSFSVMPTPSTTATLKKTKPSGPNVPIFCQVEGCNVDLSLAKEYHRKHRVCDNHSKFPKVIIGGVERRFCQQCSRFHGLSEFDEKKRSCRRRLSDHNARRRKPQQETIQFNSNRLSTQFYGGSHHMNFLLNNSKTPANSTRDNSKFTLTKEYPLKPNGDGGTDNQFHMQGLNASNELFALKNSTSEVLNPDSKGFLISSLDAAAPEYRRALSLLSSNTWDSYEQPIPLHNPMHDNDPVITQPMIHAIPESVPVSSSEFWLSRQQSNSRVQSLPTDNSLEIQLFKTPYDADFYSNLLN